VPEKKSVIASTTSLLTKSPRQYSRTVSEHYELTRTTGSAHKPDGPCFVATRHATAWRAKAQCAEMRFWPRPCTAIDPRAALQLPLIQFNSASRIHGTRARACSSMHRRAPFVTTDRGSTADRRQNLPPAGQQWPANVGGRYVARAAKQRFQSGTARRPPLKQGIAAIFRSRPIG
jgi:hypothetical protein